jgi:hypothetical protein
MQLSDGDAYSLEDAEASFWRVLELDSHNTETYESLRVLHVRGKGPMPRNRSTISVRQLD